MVIEIYKSYTSKHEVQPVLAVDDQWPLYKSSVFCYDDSEFCVNLSNLFQIIKDIHVCNFLNIYTP